jgi:hypothetical protein
MSPRGALGPRGVERRVERVQTAVEGGYARFEREKRDGIAHEALGTRDG